MIRGKTQQFCQFPNYTKTLSTMLQVKYKSNRNFLFQQDVIRYRMGHYQEQLCLPFEEEKLPQTFFHRSHELDQQAL